MNIDTNNTVGTCWLSIPRVMQKLGGISRVTLWTLRQQSDFPRGRMVSPGRLVFSERELDEYMAKQPLR